MINDFDEDCIDAVFNCKKGLLNVGLEFGEFFDQFSFCFINGGFNFSGVNIHWCKLLKIFFGPIDNNFEWFDFMPLVIFIVADSTDDAVLDTVWFQTNKIQYLQNKTKILLLQYDHRPCHILGI